MNRTILTVAGVLSASSLLLVDSAVKGTVLLALATVAALILRRDSAATRHLVWLLAIVAMLVVPVLSAMLPQWRVLPTWMSSSRPDVVAVSPPSIAKSSDGVIESPQMAEPFEVERPIATVDQRVAALPDTRPALVTQEAVPAPAVRSWNWISVLPLVWVVGFAVLMLRLSAARWMLWKSERLATVIRGRVAPQLAFESRSDSATAHDPIVTAMESICSQLGIGRPVTLLIHPHKTIPVVWGILRCRLMLPAAARQWSDEQLQSVLLHELAHIKRRDTIVQLLAQVACALHWFNPLVWFAAWRLDVERERSCDDLVLATGIRPSAYAGHLLDVVTGLSPARWTQACGLAMARKSSLEGRLTAVLGKDLNRRDVSVALAGLGLAIAVGIAVPIAMLRAADEKWNPPQAAHIGTNDFSAYCVHDGKDASFVIAYHGDFGSATESVANPKTRTWTDSGTLTAKQPGIALGFLRTHTAPDKLSITTAPAEVRDLSKPAPPPRKFGQREYDLAKGRVFLLFDSGAVRQINIATPVVTDQASAKTIAALIAAIPPQEHQDVALTTNLTGKLAPETVAKLKWGEPVNGLRMALAYPPALDDALLGKKPHFELVVQNVSKKEIHFLASDEVPNPRRMLIREGERIVQGLRDHLEVSPADWKLLPGECGVLRLFATEESNKAGTIPSSAIESDLSKIGRYHAIVQMEIAKAPAGAWTGKLVTGPTRGSADVAAAPAPMHKDARAIYENWQMLARANGDIPGALVGELAALVRQFIKYNPTWETVPKLNEILPRLDATHDWKSADAIALLDEVAAVKDSPLSLAMWRGTRHTIRKGEKLPMKFGDAAWGEAQPNGLRAAWLLEPGGVEHRIGSALKARLLVQNTGRVPVMLQVPTFHQGGVKATDAKGAEVQVSGISWTTMALLNTVRLGPGEYIEINTPGIGFGPRAGMGPWAGPRVGSNVLAKAGDELTLTHGLVPLDGSEVGVSEDDPHVSGPGWWLAHIKTRLNRELPLPADAAERMRLLDRAVRELFATAPSAEETAAFIADNTPDALDALAKRLAARVDVVPFSGKLPTAPVKFRILAADANADKQPRVVLGPGEYPLSEGTADRGAVTLKIVGRSVGDRRTNDAQLLFKATEATGKLPPDPHKLEIPDGWGTWAIVCRPGSGVFYLLSKGAVRKIDYSKPRKVTDTPANDLPVEFRDEVKRILDIHEISAAQQAEIFETPAAPAATPDSKMGANAPAKPTKAGTPKLPKLERAMLEGTWAGEKDGVKVDLKFLWLSEHQQVEWKLQTPDAGIGVQMSVVMEPDGSAAKFVFRKGLEFEATLGRVMLGERGSLRLELIPNPNPDATKYPAVKDLVLTRQPNAEEQKPAGGAILKPATEAPPKATEKKPFTAWGEEVNGVQIGVQLGEPRTYEVGENATLILRLRNNGKVQVPYRYGDEYFLKNPPLITDASGKAVTIKAMSVFGSVLLESVAPGKEVDLVQLKLDLRPATDRSKDAAWTIYGTGKFQIQYPVAGVVGEVGPDLPGMKLTTGKLELEVKEPFTAWGEAINGLQAGLGFKAGGKRVYTHGDPLTLDGETATLVVRLRNVGKEEIKFQYLRQYFIENPPTVTDAKGKLNQLGKVSAFGIHIPQEVKLAPGKEIELYEWKPYLGSGNEEGMPKYPYIFGAGKFQVQYEKVFGNSSAGTIKLDPALEKLATGKLELEVKAPEKAPVEKEPFTAWGEEVGGLQAGFCITNANDIHIGGRVKAIVKLRNVSKETISVTPVPLWMLMSPTKVVDSQGKPVRTTDGPYPLLSLKPKKLTLKPGEAVDVDKTEIPVAALNQDVKVPDKVADRRIIHVEPGKYKVNWTESFVQEHSELSTGIAEFEVKAAKEPFTAWGKEVGGLQAGLGFLPGQKRAYTHGETATLVVRVRNVGKEEVKFEYLRKFFEENPPNVTDGEGKPVWLGKIFIELQKRHIPVEANLAAGKEVELYELKLELSSGAGLGIQKFPTILGTGKFQFHYEKVLGNSSSGSIKLDPTLSKLATGKLELEIKPVAPEQPAKGKQAEIFEKPAAPAATPDSKTGANAPAKPTESGTPKLPKLPDDAYAKPGVHCQKFREEDAKRPGGERMGGVLEPSKPEDRNKEPLVLGVRTASDAQWRIGGTAKVGLVVRNRTGGIGRDHPGRDVKFSYTGRLDNGLSVVAVDEAGKEHGATIARFDGELGFQQMLVPVAHVATIKEFTIRFDAEKRGVSEPRVVAFHLPPGKYKLRCKWNDARPDVAHEGEWTGELVNEELAFTLAAAVADPPPSEAPVEEPAAEEKPAPAKPAPAKPAADDPPPAAEAPNAKLQPATETPGANIIKLPDAEYAKDGFPLDDLNGEGVMWNGEESGLSLGYRITGDEWRILGKELKVELWVRNAGKEDVKFQILHRTDEGLRVKLTGKDGREHFAGMVPNDVPLFGMKHLLSPGQCIKVNDFSVGLLPPEQNARIGNELRFFVSPGWYQLVCEVKVPGFTATRGDRKQTVPGAGEWTGTITTRSLNVEVVAPDAPPPKPRIEHVDVALEKDGTLYLNRKKVTLDELKALAAKDAKKRFTIRADKDVPYSKVIEVVDALKTAGVTEFSFGEARVGDGKYRVANRTGTYEFDDKHGFSICRPSERPQWFTVSWPAEGDRPACALRTFPNVSDKTDGKWAVVWEPGTDVLWWVDDSDVGKLTLTDPARVIVDREGRTNNFSHDFGLPEEVKSEFRRLGFVIGRDKTPGVEKTIGGNSGGQTIVSAEFGWWCIEGTVTNADGKPLANVPVRVSTNQEIKTEKTDAKGAYRVNFSLPLQLLAHSRAVTVKPVLEGFTERDMAKSGKFNVLLRAGEEPQRVRLADDKDFQPGPIPRFAERDLLPSQHGASPGKPGRADFVMLKAAK